MQLTITLTARITTVNGAPCRVWEGITENGARCLVFITAVALPEHEPSAPFDEALIEIPPPAECVPLALCPPVPRSEGN